MEGTSSTSKLESLKARIQAVLSQDRGAMNFEYYTPGEEHRQRMNKLAKIAPELYNNPSITPRSKWFDHPRYWRNSQMPPFHIHFREEMQYALRRLYDAFETTNLQDQLQHLLRASSTFHGSMRGLSGHVRIEEYACFPMYKELYPHVDIEFLYADHKDLHKAEQKVSQALVELTEEAKEQSNSLSSHRVDQIVNVIELFLEFDDQLMAHLGEEEEIVVPMSLTDNEICF